MNTIDDKLLEKSASFVKQYLEQNLKPQAKSLLDKNKNQIEQLERITQLLSLEATLERGFSLTSHEGKAISLADQLEIDDEIITLFKDGQIRSKITNIK